MANVREPTPLPPPVSAVVDTQLGRLDQTNDGALLERSRAVMDLATRHFAPEARVVILPEEIVGLGWPATRYWWAPYLAQAASGRHTIVFGADLITKMRAPDPASGRDSEIRYTDSGVVEGANRVRFDSRQPVPGALWQPGANVSAERGRLTQHYVVINGQRIALSICYENLLLWPSRDQGTSQLCP